ncbi:MAG: hypothetical protein K6T75_10960 [Acetobacteraceae bacterium]|nr:hypothetical protein [Acetobacteraceae bacterium]
MLDTSDSVWESECQFSGGWVNSFRRYRTYPAPGGAWSSGWLVWLDDDTLAVQSGGKNDPTAAMYALKVVEGK